MNDGGAPWATRLVALLVRRRVWFLAAVVAMTAVGAITARRWFVADNSARVWLLEDDPAVVAYERFQAQFGNDEVALVGVRSEAGVYTPDVLARVRRASERMRDIAGVRRVTSIGVSRTIEGDAVEIRAPRITPDGALSPADAAAARAWVERDPLLGGVLVSPDESMTVIVVQMPEFQQLAGKRPGILADIRAIAGEELSAPGLAVHYGGIGVVYDGLNRAVLRDTTVFISLAYLIILLGLWLLFRQAGWVLLGLGVIAAATVATAGLFGALDRKMNMVTSIVPTLILTVGILDLVHLIAAREDEPDAPPERALPVVIVPCVFNTVTDVIGFLALVSAPMAGVRDFGLLSAAGLALLLGVTLAVGVPVVARWRPARRRRVVGTGWLLAVVRGFAGFAARRRRAVLAAGAALLALSIAAISLVVVDTYTIEFLGAGHPARRDHARLQSALGPYVPLELTVRTGPDGAKQPELLRRVADLERAFERLDRVGRVTGLPDVVARLNEVVMDGDPAERRVPPTREAVAQELLLYEGGEGHVLDEIVDPTFSITRVTARVEMMTARGIRSLIRDMERAAAAAVGPAAEVRAAGYLPLYVKIIDNIADAQVSSFAIAFALVSAVLMLLLRSVKLGLVAMVPNVLPTVLTLGLMGVAGIRLDVGTVLLASIAIGISVNDTSHMMFRFQQEIAATPGDPRAALDRTLAATGRAVLASSVVLAVGFGILTLASTNSIRYFGGLSAVTVVTAVIADLILTPALLLTVFKAQAPRLGE